MEGNDNPKQKEGGLLVPRRRFLKIAGFTVLSLGTGLGQKGCTSEEILPSEGYILPSEGYILVDTKKCQGCLSCMIACSLVNEGEANLSLARLQVMQSSFNKWPDDLDIEQCRQCEDPACVKACVYEALVVDSTFGYVRRVHRDKCVGCKECVAACPYPPAKPLLVEDSEYEGEERSRKCDLCAGAKYHWDEAGGGPEGKQACVSVCPMGAIAFTDIIPKQKGDDGYKVNLRDSTWEMLGFPKD